MMAQQAQMNMAQMGGPVQNAGTPGSAQGMSQDVMLSKLNTAIYDYLLRNGHYSVAKELRQAVSDIDTKDSKQSPSQRPGQQVNGVDDSMDADGGNECLRDRPPELPLANSIGGDGPFLQDWWCQFWEVFAAHRSRAGGTGMMNSYIGQQRQAAIMRQNTMNHLTQANIPNRPPNAMMMAQNNMGDLKKAALQNRVNPQTLAQLRNMQAVGHNGQMMQGANQMERQGSQMDNRSGSPASGDAPSPKRQRLEGGMQPMPQGRQGQPGQMQSNNSGMQQPNMGPGGAQGSPMSQPGIEGQAGDFYQNAANSGNGARINMAGNQAAAQAAGQGGNGNHALQDYQMQLMLLEQQNKKRLLMARQEQDNMSHPGQNGSFPPGSPSAGMMDPNMPPNLRNQHMMQMQNGMGRPPSSHPAGNFQGGPAHMEMMRQNGMGMPTGPFAPGQQPPGGMMPGQQPGQPPQGTPRPGNNQMPPPPAPQPNATGTGPSSPSQQPAPPTPSTANKPKPGTKKETAKKTAAAKKNAAANATPATSESEHPPTPTPATPITPMNPKSFSQGQGGQQVPNGAMPPGQNSQGGMNGPQGQPVNGNANQPPSMDNPAEDPFGITGDFFSDMNLDLGTDNLDSYNFDGNFDGLLNDDAFDTTGGFEFDANVAFDGTIGGIEGAN